MLEQIITVVHICVSIFLILIVLLQQGKGADVGATFGGGSNTLFGASGADSLLSKVTTYSALIFMCTSVFLASSVKHRTINRGEIFQNLPATSSTSAPATPTTATPETTENIPATTTEGTTTATESTAPVSK